ncbi:hypothetical protein POV26_01305 [Aequorivita todarodis]|uniref:TapB family protein n=1 Tax=Aequorivita todarodis TaxID=2036821 RepID=UPI002350E6C7|nr:hypothetical protein [Aequorivita todarodis]MDC7999666.1 hypothetical protein [Aequorivita todarodis]
MKTWINTFALLFISCIAVSQNDCNKFYPLNEGTKFQITVYDNKEKPAAVIDYNVVNVRKSGGDKIGTINSKMSDGKGKQIADTSFDVSCNGEVVSIDFKSLINPQIFEQFGNMDYEISGANMEWPNELTVGQELPDATMDMKINMSGINMNMTVEITDRKVIGKETITSPAGSFNCFVITYTTNMKMGMSQRSTSKQWVAEKIGTVKSVNYDKNGKVTGSSLLTKFEE